MSDTCKVHNRSAIGRTCNEPYCDQCSAEYLASLRTMRNYRPIGGKLRFNPKHGTDRGWYVERA